MHVIEIPSRYVSVTVEDSKPAFHKQATLNGTGLGWDKLPCVGPTNLCWDGPTQGPSGVYGLSYGLACWPDFVTAPYTPI